MSDLATTSRVQLAYVKETIFGQTPTTGNSKALRMTGESLTYNLSKEVSNEINALRSSASSVPTKAEVSGSVNAEISFAEYDELMAAALQGTWATLGAAGVSTPVDLTFTTTKITAASAPTGSSAFTNLQPGQWFMVKGTGANAAKLFRVSKTVATTATEITLDVNTPATAGTMTAANLMASRLSNGVTQPSFTLERQIPEVGEYFAYSGATVSSMKIKVAKSALSTLEFGFMGAGVENAQVSVLPGALAPSKAYDIMSGVSGTVCTVLADGAPIAGTYVTSVDLNYDNALRHQGALCKLASVGVGSGTIKCEGNAELYFASGAKFFSDFVTNKKIEFVFTSFDTSGNGYVFTLPACTVDKYEVTAGGKDQELMAKIMVTGLYDAANANPNLRKVLIIDRIGDAMS